MTNSNQRWIDPADPLKKFLAALGFDASRKFNEWPDTLTFDDPNFQTDKLTLSTEPLARQAQLTGLDRVMQDLKEKYGATLTLQLNADPYELNIHDYTPQKLEDFCDMVAGNPFNVHIQLEKKELAAHWDIAADTVDFKVFLFPEALARSLLVPLTDLEQGDDALMPAFTGEKKLIILVPDHNIALNGEYLAVLGGDAVANWKSYLPTEKPEIGRKKIAAIQGQLEETRWTDISLTHLTPLQLNVACDPAVTPDKSDDVANALYSQLLACSLLYFANNSISNQRKKTLEGADPGADDHSWVASFEADKYFAEIEVGDTRKIIGTLTSTNPENPLQSPQTIGDLVTWIYKEDRGSGNRREVLQAVIANSLQDNKPADNLRELVRRAPEISARVKRRWDDFIGEKLNKYFSQIKDLENSVDATTKSYNEQVQALTKTLIDSMLAAVGVIVGSFIAAVFKSPFVEYVFRIGAGIYLGYLAVFPIGIGLVSARQRFNDSSAAFKKRTEAFSKRLTKTEVDAIVGSAIKDREAWFRSWFRFTTGLYVLVFVAVLTAIIFFPAVVKRWGDDFKLNGISYSGAPTSETVPVVIRGENFDNNKEIVVTFANRSFTNTDGKGLKVHGSSVLVFSPRQQDVAGAIEKNNRLLGVTQGSSAVQTIEFPSIRPSIPQPEFETWTRRVSEGSRFIEASGDKFGSISEISFNGAKLHFKISEDGRKLTLGDAQAGKSWLGKVLEITLKNGEQIKVSTPKLP